MKLVFLVTNGPLREGQDPEMSEIGAQQVKNLRRHLPAEIPQIWIGEGRLHQNMIEALGLNSHGNKWFSGIWGGANNHESRNIQDMYVLPSGVAVSADRLTSISDQKPSIIAKLKSDDVLDGAFICVSREVMVAFGVSINSAKYASLYRLTIDPASVSAALLATG